MSDRQIAIWGAGLMGAAMARRFLGRGWQVGIWNRHPEKTGTLVADGAVALDLPGSPEFSPVMLNMLSDGLALKSALNAVPPSAWPGRTLLQMATIAPRESQVIAQHLQKLGAYYLEAPVLGSISEVESGTLQILVGGDPDLLHTLQPLLAVLGTPRHVGDVGQAATMKLALNQMITGLTATFSLSLGMLRALDADIGIFMDILRQSALYAPTFDKKLTRYLNDDYTRPNFPERHLLKDMRLFAETSAGKTDGRLPALWLDLLEALEARAGDLDYSVLYRALQNPFP